MAKPDAIDTRSDDLIIQSILLRNGRCGKRGIEDLELRCKVCNALHYLEMKYGKTGYKILWDNLS